MLSVTLLHVSNFNAAVSFYSPLMAALSFRRDSRGVQRRFSEQHQPWAGWYAEGDNLPVVMTSLCGDDRTPALPPALTFYASTRDMVERAWHTALQHGAKSREAPQSHPEFHAHYYSAGFDDHEGRPVYVVCHVPD